jgi:hypothetical protein
MIPDSLWSLLQIVAGFGLALSLGFGVSFFLLPREYRRYALAAAPGAGYAVFCLAAMVISGGFRLPANMSVWIAFAALASISAAALALAIRKREIDEIWRGAKPAAWSLPLMIAVVFWPVLYQGVHLYLGTANPDFYQSLAYQEVLTRFNIGTLAPRPAIDYSLNPFFGTFPDPLPARFGGVMFSMLQQKLLGLPARATLMTSIAVFLLALPLSTYLFTKIVLQASDRVAAASALLIAVSAPVTMSFIHVLVGQNSSLALLPLCLSICYLAVATRDWRALLFALLLIDAAFWVYVMILPYVAAPIGVYAAFDAVRRPRGAMRWIATAVGLAIIVFVSLQWGLVRETKGLVEEIVQLLGRANRTVYVDFLTDMSLPYSVGITSYPMTSNGLLTRLSAPNWPAWEIGFVAFSFLALAFYFRAVATWGRQVARGNRDFVWITIAIYGAVWIYFSFISLYGYALFKMASLMQFLFAPFIAYGLLKIAGERQDPPRGGLAAAAVAIAAGLIVANVVSSIDFGVKGLGRDTRTGAIANSYGIGGNPDYGQLETALRGAVPPGAVVAIAMPDFISNLWTAYHVVRSGMRASFVSHDDFPDEDVVLPDVKSGRVRNSVGHVAEYRPRYFADRPAYYLLEGPGNLNQEIVEEPAKPQPIWSDRTFTLVAADKAKDILATGRGFYRLEYFDQRRLSWWWPERMRWTPEGGEFLLLNASRPDLPHYLSFVAVAGKDREKTRHLELWLNGKLFDELEVHGAARIVSKPFFPTGGRDKLVVKVRERVGLSYRNFGLWNWQIPSDPRYLNLAIAQARIRSTPDIMPAAAKETLSPKDLIDTSNRFDGISLDGWAAEKAYFEVPLAAGVRHASLSIQVPGWAGFHFPFRVRFKVDGRQEERQFPAPGDYTIQFDRTPGSGNLLLEMQADQATKLAGIGKASFVIKSLAIR